jgi:hypothetical protein
MKRNLLLLAFSVITFSSFAQSNWSMGIQLASVGNDAVYSGGMSGADARFHQNPFNGGSLAFIFRYKISDRWTMQTGLGFTELGFSYAIANNYSLLRRSEHFTFNNSNVCVSEVPAMALYTFKPNCRSWRYFAGIGGKLVINSGETTMDITTHPDESVGVTGNTFIEQHMHADAFISPCGTFTFGIEKLMKRGNIFSISLVANKGFMEITNSTVRYDLDGTTYEHSFTNYGDYCGLALAYHFKPFGSKKALNSDK